ncbi:hypothetical protein [Glycomyces terrestris]|nr:hypothetical protein [Glycomyces terrestris]
MTNQIHLVDDHGDSADAADAFVGKCAATRIVDESEQGAAEPV